MPSKLYYEGDLRADDSIKRRPPVGTNLGLFWPRGSPQYPIMFCDVIGKEADQRTGAVFKGKADLHSKYNEAEVEKTVK